MRAQVSLISSIVMGVLSAALLGSAGVALADPRPTDQDAIPGNFPFDYANNFPATYNESLLKVLDLSSDLNIPASYLEYEFHDLKAQREFNAFRSVVREMLWLQTNSDPIIRTRDLPNPYTASLSAYCSYYHNVSIDQPGCIKEEPITLTPSQPVVPPPASRPAPVESSPVPALW